MQVKCPTCAFSLEPCIYHVPIDISNLYASYKNVHNSLCRIITSTLEQFTYYFIQSALFHSSVNGTSQT